jgi:hypothetical protein
LRDEKTDRAEEEPRDETAEDAIAALDDKERSDDPAAKARDREPPRYRAIAAARSAISPKRRKRSGDERHRARRVRGNGRNIDGEQSGKCEERAAAPE